MRYANFDENKALAAILFVAHELQTKAPEKRADLYKLLKVLYFADRKHLSRYNRAIAGDHYVAMADGPVPSNIYDILKFIRGDGSYNPRAKGFGRILKHALRIQDQISVIPEAEPEVQEFSESDIECLSEAIMENKDLNFYQLKKKSHDKAYYKADHDNRITFEDIAIAEGADKKVVSFVSNWLENENFCS